MSLRSATFNVAAEGGNLTPQTPMNVAEFQTAALGINGVSGLGSTAENQLAQNNGVDGPQDHYTI